MLADDFALMAQLRGKTRHALGMRAYQNAAIGALLLADLVLAGNAELDPAAGTIRLLGPPPGNGLLAAAAGVVTAKGPKIKAVLSGLDRGLRQDLDLGTWDALAPKEAGGATREAVVARYQAAAAGDGELDDGTAMVLSLIGPARLLEVVAPERGAARRHARERIDHALDGRPLEAIATAVRRIILEMESAAAVVVTGV